MRLRVVSADSGLPGGVAAPRHPTLQAGVTAGALWTVRARAYLALTKPRVVLLLTYCGMVAALAAGMPPGAELALFGLLAAMAAAGAACVNQVLERDLDRCMDRTRRRPLPGDVLTPGQAGMLATTLLLTSLAGSLVLFGPAVAAALAAGAFIYAVVYTWWLKRSTAWNVIIGGLAGSAMVMAGWSLAGELRVATGWIMALVVFLWTPPHFWSLAIACHDDYRWAGIPMLPQVAGFRAASRSMSRYAVLTWLSSLALVATGDLGLLYGAAAVPAGAAFAAAHVYFHLRFRPELAAPLFKMSGIYLFVVFTAMLADVLTG